MRLQGPDGRFIKQDVVSRFWDFVDRSAGPDGCWPFTGEITKVGYGRITDYREKHLAHRFAWEFHHGPVPEGLFVLHRCDNRPCVNPSHLWLGTHADNMADAATKDRMSHRGGPPRLGIANNKAKLTDEDVRAIRAAYVPLPSGFPAGARWGKRHTTPSVRDLAHQYGVTPTAIHQILVGNTWRHLL